MSAQGDRLRAEGAVSDGTYAELTQTQNELMEAEARLSAATTRIAELEIALADCEGGVIIEPPVEPPVPVGKPNVTALAGVHVLHQFPQVAGASKTQALNELLQQTPNIRSALSVPGVSAFGMRVPWNIIDSDFQILDEGIKLANDAEVEFTVRLMAGRHTPARVFTAMGSAWTLGSSGTSRFPKPYDAGANLNTAFLNEYAALMHRLSNWCVSSEVRLIHMSHYAKEWAEFYFGPEIQQIIAGTPGQDAFVKATLALVEMGLGAVDPDISLELPMSGHGPVMRGPNSQNPGIAERVAMGITSGLGGATDRFYIQGNGVDEDGIWGAPAESTEVLMDLVLKSNLFFGGQMIQPYNTYAWGNVFDQIVGAKASYFEVYLPSFSGGTSASLKGQTGAMENNHLWRVS